MRAYFLLQAGIFANTCECRGIIRTRAVARYDHAREVEVEPYGIFAHPVHEVSKSLISKNLNIELPNELLHSFTDGTCIKIFYKGERSMDPIISSVAKKYDVHLSILHGKIDYIHKKPLGILLVHLSGSDTEIQKAKQYIQENVAEMEIIRLDERRELL